MGDLKSARTPYIYNVALNTKNTEYSQLLPSGLRSMRVECSVASLLDIYFTTGATLADRFRMKANGIYEATGLDLPNSTYIYFNCQSTTGTARIIGWGG